MPHSNPALIHDGDAARTLLVDGMTAAGYTADCWSLDLGGDAPGWVELSQGAAPAPCLRHGDALGGAAGAHP